MGNFSNMFERSPATITAAAVLTPSPTVTLEVGVPTRNALVVVKPQLPANIEEIGRTGTTKINKISEQVLAKVKTADTGKLGSGITDILSLTATVDMSKIEEGTPGLIGSLTNLFKRTRVKVLAQYEDVNKQVERIATELKGELQAMQAENKWLEEMYNENLTEIRSMKNDLDDLRELLVQQQKYVEHLRATLDESMESAQKIQDEANNQIRIERHIDRLERLIQIGIMDAPDIRSLQKNNLDTITDFNDVIDVTLPLWKRQLTLALTAARQVKRAELGTAIKDRNNDLMHKRADMMHDASIKTATLGQRSSVADIETLEYTQAKLIDRLTQVKQIEHNGRQQRALDAQRIATNREQLRLEMKSWSTP